MAKANSPLAALESLEQQFDLPKNDDSNHNLGKTPLNNSQEKSRKKREREENYPASELETQLEQTVDKGRYVTRNYGYKYTIDQDIDELRVKLKKAGVTKTKQELVNQLLEERLAQLKEKGYL